MTFRKWALLYEVYKSEYDKEFMMQTKHLLYEDLNKEASIDDVIPI